ncbi:MAG: XRE family transcriptional regulator, partial [Acidobacteria bacterium]
MAEGNRRFGQYLRALRHSKHLTLDDVCQLSRDEPVPISRAVLSDLENGRANLTTGRLITLSRIYGVRPAVLVERFETDYELDLADRDRIEKWPTQKLFDEARRAGMSGHVHRALLLYEEAELRALEGKDEDSENVRVRARLGVARA